MEDCQTEALLFPQENPPISHKPGTQASQERRLCSTKYTWKQVWVDAEKVVGNQVKSLAQEIKSRLKWWGDGERECYEKKGQYSPKTTQQLEATGAKPQQPKTNLRVITIHNINNIQLHSSWNYYKHQTQHTSLLILWLFKGGLFELHFSVTWKKHVLGTWPQSF